RANGRFEDEGWRLRKDGSRFWANVVITALRNPSGELRGFAKVTRDLTERRQAEERLRQAYGELETRIEARTAELTEANRALAAEVEQRRQTEAALARERERLEIPLTSIGDAVIVVSPEGLVTFLNPVAEGLTGWTQAEALGRQLTEVFHIINEKTQVPAEQP